MFTQQQLSEYPFFCKETTDRGLAFLKDLPVTNPFGGYEPSGVFTVEFWHKTKKLTLFFNLNGTIEILLEEGETMWERSVETPEQFMGIYRAFKE